MITNSKGRVLYGMHMYPGVAEYKDQGDGFRVFLNENTIRSMGPTFAGRPVYVEHIDGDVPNKIDEVKKEADGWVVDSFYNEADGKHWVKFIICSERGEKAIQSGYRLSNCYRPTAFDKGGEWNGVTYTKEIKGGEYEHLALVQNPRYEESVVMDPDQFKTYNEKNRSEIDRFKNHKDEGNKVKLNFFKKQKLENSADLESVVVLLPKSGREVDITTLVNEADEKEMKAKEPMVADPDHLVNVGGKTMKVGDLCNEYLKMGDDSMHEAVDQDQHGLENETAEEVENDAVDDEAMENAEVESDEDVKKAAKAVVKHEEKEIADAKKKNSKPAAKVQTPEAKAKAEALRNAHTRGNLEDEGPTYDPFGAVERGKARYGS